MPSDRRPIGYWLKLLDGLIEAVFEEALAAEGLDRRRWQVLNTLAAAPATPGELDAALAPFLAGDPGAARSATADLVTRGWVAMTPDGHRELTPRGREAHERADRAVGEARRCVMHDVTPDEYRATVDVLRRMAGALGGQAAAASEENASHSAA